MKKIRFKLILFIGILILLFGFTTLAIKGSGYKDYLDILENSLYSKEIDHFTVDTDYDLKLDGTTNMAGKNKYIVEKENGEFKKVYMYGNYKSLEREFSMESYHDQEKYIMKSSDGNYMENEDLSVNIMNKLDGLFSPRIKRALMSIIIGDAKNQISFDGKRFAMHLEGNQIPLMDKILFGIIANLSESRIEQNREALGERYIYIENYTNMKNIEVQSIDYSSNTEDDKLKDISIKVIITADDSFGYRKNIEINFFSEMNYIKAEIPEIKEDAGD